MPLPTILAEVAAMRGDQPAALVQRVVGGADLGLDTEPRLITFDHKGHDVQGGFAWQRHERTLREGGVNLVLGATAAEVRLGPPVQGPDGGAS